MKKKTGGVGEKGKRDIMHGFERLLGANKESQARARSVLGGRYQSRRRKFFVINIENNPLTFKTFFLCRCSSPSSSNEL